MRVTGDAVSHPSHYTAGGLEAMDALKAIMDGAPPMPPMAHYWWGCAFKYIWRWPHKGGIEDLRKAKQCLEYAIEELAMMELDG